MDRIYEIDPSTILFPVSEHGVLQRLGSVDMAIVDPSEGLAFISSFSPPATLAVAGMRFTSSERLPGKETSSKLNNFTTEKFSDIAHSALRLRVLRECGDSTVELESDHKSAKSILTAINLVAEDLAADISTMGAATELSVSEQLGTRYGHILRRALAELTRISTALSSGRKAFVDGQLANIATADKLPRLHLGAGGNNLERWYNIDLMSAELCLNLRWKLPFSNNSIDFVFLSHMFEHLYKRRDAPALLAEIYRVLRPGGTARIIVPDARTYMRAYVENDEAFFAMQRQVWFTWAPKARTKLEAILGYLGAPEFPGGLAQHKYGYDFETLKVMLMDAGFQKIEQGTFMGSRHEALRVDEASYVASANVDGRYASLFIEAEK